MTTYGANRRSIVRRILVQMSTLRTKNLSVISPTVRHFTSFVRDTDNMGGKDDQISVLQHRSGRTGKLHPMAARSMTRVKHRRNVAPDGNTCLLSISTTRMVLVAKGFLIRIAHGWLEFPRKVEIPNYYNNDAQQALSYRAIKRHHYVGERKDTYGGRDLYASHLGSDGQWSERKSGGEINSAGVEERHSLHPWCNTLFLKRRSWWICVAIFFLAPPWWYLGHCQSQRIWPVNQYSGWDGYYTIPASGEYAILYRMLWIWQEDIIRVKLPKALKPNTVLLVSDMFWM